jgi:rubrerythrin
MKRTNTLSMVRSRHSESERRPIANPQSAIRNPQCRGPRLARPGDFIKAVVEGAWYCERCERIVRLSHDLDSPAQCPLCHKQTAVWLPPV